MALLTVQSLTKRFLVRKGFLRKIKGYTHAVENISFSLDSGRTLGLVGESGCGKTTLGRTILRLIEPTSGTIIFDQQNISEMSKSELPNWRKKAQIIFQDPFSSLNPRMRVRDIIGEGIVIHRSCSRSKVLEEVSSLLELVGLESRSMDKFPHQFSGGQRQRIGIARALALNPQMIVADEPVSALDVSVQAQIINLLLDLQQSRKLTYLFISHDLRIVEFVAEQVMVMYLGRVMEMLPAKGLALKACHPYTQALLSAVLTPDEQGNRTKKKRVVLGGEVPNPMSPPSGCVFHPRCPLAAEVCRKEDPVLRNIGQGHSVACHLV